MSLNDFRIAGWNVGRRSPALRFGAIAGCIALLVGAISAAPADRYPANGGDIEITPFLHSSVQLEHAGKVIHIDPWSVSDLSRAKPADLILISDDVGLTWREAGGGRAGNNRFPSRPGSTPWAPPASP